MTISSLPINLGIITFSDKKYFNNFRLFFMSLNNFHKIPVCLFFDTLDQSQIDWCYKNNIILKKIDSHHLFSKNIIAHNESLQNPLDWRTMLKPYCFMRSPFLSTFWMDSDMFVIRCLDGLFEKINDGPVFSAETCCGSRYVKGFLEFMPEPIEANPKIHVNAGLIGLNIDRDLDCTILYKWTSLINYCTTENNYDSSLKINYFTNDQPCLLWTIEKLKISNYIMNHIDSSKYNHSPNPRVEFLEENLIEKLKQTYDHRLIHHNELPHCLHFFGSPKLSQLYKKQIEDIIL